MSNPANFSKTTVVATKPAQALRGAITQVPAGFLAGRGKPVPTRPACWGVSSWTARPTAQAAV